MVKHPQSWYQGKQLIKKRRSDGIIQGYWVTILDDIEDDITENLKTVEWIIHWDYTDGSPSGIRQWEVRIHVPSDLTEDEVIDISERALNRWIDGELIESSSRTVYKSGVDVVSDNALNYARYKVIDNARKQYNYPKGKWGVQPL